jgi:hypothetical protein
MTEPKVTLKEWRERVNAGRNSGAGSTQPGIDGGDGSSSSGSVPNGKPIPKGSGNPLHPDVSEEIGRLRDTILVLKKQIYGSSIPGEIGLVVHLQDIEDKFNRLVNNLNASVAGLTTRITNLEQRFDELLEMLGVEDEEEDPLVKMAVEGKDHGTQ